MFWHLGNRQLEERRHRNQAPAVATNNTVKHPGPLKALGALNYLQSAPLLSTLDKPSSPTGTNAKVASAKSLLAYRLSNSAKSLVELMQSEQAILLRNALLDTSANTDLPIPEHLRAEGDPGSYVVQARGPLDDAFRAQLQAANARIISYIPNNGYLVRMSENSANQLRSLAQTQTVLPWEPYYKLDLPLLALAVQNKPLPDGTLLNLLFFPGEREKGLDSLQGLGADVLGEDRSPFGHQVVVQPPPDSLVSLARLSGLQEIEIYRPRQLANDLSRRRVGVVTNTTVATNYLGLTGANVIVGLNDTGVDKDHPTLTGRVIGQATNDLHGHGTHVAGTIAGSGTNSPSGTNTPPGSVTNANFRGMAPAAKLFTLPVDLLTGPVISDSYLQEATARTNVFISNNSWNYVGQFDYNLSAASFDAAVRDALPGNIGSQPLLVVFSADNSGGGGSQGQGGVADSIASPGTAKNVITVGAIENLRNITNRVVNASGQTNQAFLGDTDSNDQVAGFSSRGNVGIGLEGPAGRFKPDVVAPGTFIVSSRASQWKDPTNSVSVSVNRIPAQEVDPGESNLYNIFVPNNGVQLGIRTLPNLRSPTPFPSLPIYVKKDAPPIIPTDLAGYGEAFFPVDSGNWFYAIGNTNNRTVNYDLQTVLVLTNNAGTYFEELKKLNDKLAPDYRFESGTSMSAGVVSGVLALMQEMFEQRLGRTNSPALMKALLINGARSVGTLYNLHVQTDINYEGWGVVNLSNSVPAALTNGPGTEATWPIVFFEQDSTTALATGQSHTRTLMLKANAQFYPLRVTLVWTDPPGNPAASLKLVNDLDLIVSNRVTGEIYIGNNIPAGSDFNDVTDPADTNAPPLFDMVNNVENVFINGPIDADYDIVVRARRVNVNAVTAHTNGIVQDYALVISSGNTRLTNFIDTLSPIVHEAESVPYVKSVTNGVPTLNERVGANSPLLVSTNGATNQWNFYVFQNSGATNTNVAFVTFLAPNLSRSRQRDADIDLYVSTNPDLTNLTAFALAGAVKSLARGGTELVILANAPPGLTYYVGVKSEDQQAANFGIFAVASGTPFGQRDANGNIPLQFIPGAVDIPDGSPQAPQAGVMLAIVADPAVVRRVTFTNTITHENGGDLLGNLDHGERFAVLNNHRSFSGPVTYVYDDSGENDILASRPTDGPGSLRDFTGESAYGVWTLAMVDDSPNHIGRVEGLIGLIEPQDDLTSAAGILLTAGAGLWRYASIEVPVGATNLIVSVVQQNSSLPLELYVRRGAFPDQNTFDKFATITAPGGSLSVGLTDNPPLRPGRYFIGVFNPNAVPVSFRLRAELQYGLSPSDVQTYLSADTPMTLIDDAITNSVINVNTNELVADLKVGVRIDHPRISDLVLHLVNPQGTRILLAENRGSTLATSYGFGNTATNTFYATFTDSTNLGGPLKFAIPPFYALPTNQIIFTNSFENAAVTNYAQGQTFEGWAVLTNGVAVLTDTNLARTGSNVLALSNGKVRHFLPTVSEREYQLSFAYRKVSSAPTQSVSVAVSTRADIFKHLHPPTNAPGSIDALAVPKLRVCPGQEVMIGAATNCVIADGVTCVGPEGNTNILHRGLPLHSLIGCWSYSPKLLDSNTVASVPFYIGTNTLFTAPVAPGDYYLFLGYNDDDFTNNFGSIRVTNHWQQCQLATARYALGNATNALSGEFYWQTNSVNFVGNPNLTNLTFIADHNTTMLFDSVELAEASAAFYLPEEPMTPLRGELAQGDWKLEIWDNRVGPIGNPGTLLSWTLNLTFAPAAASIPLTNCVPFTDQVRGEEIKYFVVEVPLEATEAVNTLGGAGVELLYSRNGLPAGTTPPDPVFYPLPNPWIITTNSPVSVALQPGQRYFLGVRNTNPNATNTFSIRVDFDLPLLSLPNNIFTCALGVTNTIGSNLQSIPAATNILYPGTNMHYYKYFVFADTNSQGATFELSSTNADVQLVAKRALAITNFLPTPIDFDYQSVECAPGQERIVVLTNSFPVRLEPQLWILGIYNVSTNNADYRLTACQWTNSPSLTYPASPPHSVMTVSNDATVPFFVGPANTLDFFVHTILDQTNSAVLFELCNLTGDADLLVRRSDLPSKCLFDFSNFRLGTSGEQIVLSTNVFIPHLNATNWFLTIVNKDNVPVSGNIHITVATNNMLMPCAGPNIMIASFNPAQGPTIEWTSLPGQTYSVLISTDLVTWSPLTTIRASGYTTVFQDPTPAHTQALRFYQIRQEASP